VRSESRESRELREAFSRIVLARRARRPQQLESPSLQEMAAPAFRAVVADRLRSLERDLAEVRARVNGLLFVVAGAVATQVVLRLFG
jgi:hypothetical protein